MILDLCNAAWEYLELGLHGWHGSGVKRSEEMSQVASVDGSKTDLRLNFSWGRS
jgi:hypothetical protein